MLLFGEESDTTEALARGQTGLAVAHHMRGAFIAGTTGVGLAYGAAAGYTAWGTSSLAFAASAFLAPLGVALAVVAIGGIVLSLGFYLFSPKDDTPENKMKPLRDALDLAASVELGVTEKGGEPDKARTVRALEDLAFFCRTLRRGS